MVDGHKTNTPLSITYTNVVSRDSFRIYLKITALNDLDILAADIENAYLSDPNQEKFWIRDGPEFGNL